MHSNKMKGMLMIYSGSIRKWINRYFRVMIIVFLIMLFIKWENTNWCYSIKRKTKLHCFSFEFIMKSNPPLLSILLPIEL